MNLNFLWEIYFAYNKIIYDINSTTDVYIILKQKKIEHI